MENGAVQISYQSSKSEENNFFRYAVVMEYIGTNYAGSQIQPNQKTIQSELENVLNVLCKKRIKTIFSGRTDSGVHSKGQVVHFDLENEVDTYKFINSMNALLPSDISVSAMTKVDKTFHSLKSAKFRWYRYKISNRSQRSVWDRESTFIREDLNVEAMSKALECMLGHHDFSAFKCSKTLNPAKECTVYNAKCFKSGDNIYIDIVADRFLYNMIRIIVGTLLKIGKGQQSPLHFEDVLKSKDRTLAGPTAVPDGLTLMYVSYSKKYNLTEYINKEANKDENIFRQAS